MNVTSLEKNRAQLPVNKTFNNSFCARKEDLKNDVFECKKVKKQSFFEKICLKIKGLFAPKKLEKTNETSQISFGSAKIVSKAPYILDNLQKQNKYGKKITIHRIKLSEIPKSFTDVCHTLFKDGNSFYIDKKEMLSANSQLNAKKELLEKQIDDCTRFLYREVNKVGDILAGLKDESLRKIGQQILEADNYDDKHFLIFSNKASFKNISEEDKIRLKDLLGNIIDDDKKLKRLQGKIGKEYDADAIETSKTLLDRFKCSADNHRKYEGTLALCKKANKLTLQSVSENIPGKLTVKDTDELSFEDLYKYGRIARKYDFIDVDISLIKGEYEENLVSKMRTFFGSLFKDENGNIDEKMMEEQLLFNDSSYRAIHSMHRLFGRVAKEPDGSYNVDKIDSLLSQIKDALAKDPSELYSGMPKEIGDYKVGIMLGRYKLNNNAVNLLIPNCAKEGDYYNVVFDKEGKLVTLYETTKEQIYKTFCPILSPYTSFVEN